MWKLSDYILLKAKKKINKDLLEERIRRASSVVAEWLNIPPHASITNTYQGPLLGVNIHGSKDNNNPK